MQNLKNTSTRCVARFFPFKDRSMDESQVSTGGGDGSGFVQSDGTGNPSVQNNHWFPNKDKMLNDFKGKSTNNAWWPDQTKILANTKGAQSKPPLTEPQNSHGSNQTFGKMASDEFIEDDAIIRFSMAKDMSLAAPTFQIVIKPTKNFYNLIKPGDWVMVYLGDTSHIDVKGTKGVVCIGQVDRIALNRVKMKDGTLSNSFMVHGSGFGKLMAQTMVFFSPYVLDQVKKYVVQSSKYQKGGSPLDFIQYYLDVFTGDAMKAELEDNLFQMLVPPKLYKALSGKTREKGSDVCFRDLLNTEYDPDTNEGFLHFRDITTSNTGSLWNLLLQSANLPVNELYTDTRDGKPYLILQKQPLTKSLLAKRLDETRNVKKYELGLEYIVNSNVGIAEAELKNYIYILPSSELTQALSSVYKEFYPSEYPNLNRESIRRFGLRVANFSTEYAYDNAATLKTDVMLKWKQELGEFWVNRWRMESGTIELIGKHDFEIGKFYHIPEIKMAYRPRGVQYDWQFGEDIVTTLTVTHGVKSSGEFVDSNKSDKLSYGISHVRNPNTKGFA